MADKENTNENLYFTEQRRKAEAELAERRRNADALPPMEADVQRLVYELEVHQIQLEMQNEELWQARAEREAVLDQHIDLYDFAPIGYFTLVRDGAIRKVNLTGAKLLGVERSNLLEKRFGFFVADEFRVVFTDFLEGVFESKKKESLDLMVGKRGEEPQWVLIEAICTDDQKECRATVTDITARKQAIEALGDSEELLRVTLSSISDPVFITDDDGNFFYICPNVTAALGFSIDEIKRIGNIEKFVGNDLFRLGDLKEQGEIANLEHSLHDKSGRQHDFLVSVKQVSIGKGSILYTFRDITERKQAEKALEESRTRFRAIAEHTPDHIVIHDRELKYTMVINPQLGLTEEDMLGKTDHDLLSKEEADTLVEAKQQVMASGNPLRFETSLKSQSGKSEFFTGTFMPTFDEKNLPNGLIGYFRNVTERKEAEAQTRYQANLLNTVGQSVIVTELGGKITYWNRFAENLYGWPADEAIGKNIMDVTVSHASKEQAAEIMERLSAGEIWSGDFLVQRQDGTTFPAFVTNTPIVDDQGALTGIIGVSSDITKRKEIENQIIKAKERAEEIEGKLKAAMESMADAVFISDQEGNFIDFNEAFATFHKFKNKEECAKTLKDFPVFLDVFYSDGEFLPLEMWVVSRALRGETGSNEEYILKRKDTAETWVGSYNYSPIRNNEGDIVGSVVTARDITEQKKAEAKLRNSEKRFRALFEQAGDYCMILDPHTEDGIPIIVDANEASYKRHGYTREEFIGRPVADIDDAEGKRLVVERTQMIMSGQPFYVENIHARKDGTTFPVSVHANRIDIEGEPSLIFTTEYDISERKQAEEMLKKSEADLKKAQQISHVGSWAWYPASNRLEWSDEMFRIFGIEQDKFSGDLSDIMQKAIHPDDRAAVEESNLSVINDGKPIPLEYRIIRPDGTVRTVWAEAGELILDETGNLAVLTGIVQDISERKKAEAALREGEEQFRRAVVDSPVPIMIHDEDDNILQLSKGWTKYSGYLLEEIPTMSVWTEKAYGSASGLEKKYIDELFEIDKTVDNGEWTVRAKDGSTRIWEFKTTPLGRNAKGKRLLHSMAVDITERKKAEDALRLSEYRMRSLFENMAEGVALHEVIFDESGEPVNYCILDFNLQYEKILGITRKDVIDKLATEAYGMPEAPYLREYVDVLLTDRSRHMQIYFPPMNKYFDISIAPWGEKGFATIFTDITERKQAEAQLKLQSHALESAANAIVITDTEGIIEWINPAFSLLTGYSAEDVLGKNPRVLKSGQQEAEFYKNLWDTIASGGTWRGEVVNKRKDGVLYTEEMTIAPLVSDDGKINNFVAVKEDISERVQSEITLKQYTSQLETLNTVTAALSTSLESDKVLELILAQIGRVIPFNSGSIFLYEEDRLRVVADLGIEPSLIGKNFPGENELFQIIRETRKPLIVNKIDGDPRFQNWGMSEKLGSWMGVPLFVRDTLIGNLTLDNHQPDAYTSAQAALALSFASQAAQAIQNARLYQEATQRLERMDSLRKIDQAIISDVDLETSLNILLDQLQERLGVDAAAVLLYEKKEQVLGFFQGRGFQSAWIQETNLLLGQGFAGKVALDRRDLFIRDFDQSKFHALRPEKIKEESFISYYGIPLIAKEQLIGVLEIFHRSSLNPDNEWVSFLQTLAGQAAIAIDNITLYSDLQSLNTQLSLAYDATIEGWADALELKDMETEGHSRRVVETTIMLARTMGYSIENLAHIRRGALLHDIGKMGVPDAILQKSGPLTESEWQVMREHPVYAHKWLSSIEYLKPALNIPYCHHEKWDGTGYPRGLAGEEIPLDARIFAIVDVWDALRSDRPYRKAWPREKILAYIQAESAKHFDPQVVAAFIRYLD